MASKLYVCFKFKPSKDQKDNNDDYLYDIVYRPDVVRGQRFSMWHKKVLAARQDIDASEDLKRKRSLR